MNIVNCQQLSKRYGNTHALDSIDLSLDAGAPIALIGPNGAGKTTLFSILCGFLRSSSGGVEVLGSQPGSTALHGKLAALPQDANLDPRFSIGHQLGLFARLQGLSAKQAKIESKRVLEQVGLPETFAMRPEALSHGMRKRVLFAQALMGKPALILLDEPTAGLDPPNVKAMRQLIREAAPKATFIISSHNLDELEKVCHSVVHLEKGRLKRVVSIDQAKSSGYLTLVMAELAAPVEQMIAALGSIAGVREVTFNEPNRFLLDYDAEGYPNLDQQVMQQISTQGWKYRQLVNGRTLEDQLYFE
ncbi:MAG: ABC transporter ATP-binding protein [Leucothrix sp.]